MKDIDKRLEELRKKWIEEPANRKIIEMQARALKIALELKSENYTGVQEKLI